MIKSPLINYKSVVLLLSSLLCYIFGVDFGDVSPYFCTDNLQFDLGCGVERAAHSVDHMFSLYFSYIQFWFLKQDIGSDCSSFW